MQLLSGRKIQLQYYLTRRGSFIDFVRGNSFYTFSEASIPGTWDKRTYEAALTRFPQALISVYCLADQPAAKYIKGVEILPINLVAGTKIR